MIIKLTGTIHMSKHRRVKCHQVDWLPMRSLGGVDGKMLLFFLHAACGSFVCNMPVRQTLPRLYDGVYLLFIVGKGFCNDLLYILVSDKLV